MHTKWITVTEAPHWHSRLIPSSSPPVAVGGADQNDASIPDIRVYDDYSKSWRTVATLSSARSYVAIAAVKNNAIIVIGGYTKGGSVAKALSSSLTTVELGQVQLIH